MNVRSTAELVDLLWALYEEQLTPEQENQLEQELCRSALARQLYVRFMGIQGLLGWNIVPQEPQSAAAIVAPGSASATGQSSVGRSPILGYLSQTIVAPLISHGAVFWLVAIVTNALLVCTLAVVLSPNLRARLTGEQHATAAARWTQSSTATPARLISARDCRWDPASYQPAVGEDLEAGRLRLLAGVVELEFAGGARVSFLGPSEFDIRDVDQVHLEVGELRALVPRQAIGFRVLTPSAEVVDLGTEFGVRVSGLETFVHCVRGKVRMQPSAKSPEARAPRQLLAGHSGSIDGNGWVEPKATAGSTVSPLSSAKLVPPPAVSEKVESSGEEVAAAQLINVQIAPDAHLAYEGPGVVKGGKRAMWSVTAPFPAKPKPLHTGDGAPTGVSCAIENATTCTTIFNASGDDLHDTYCFVSGDAIGRLTISGLAAKQNYDLYLFGTSGIAKGDADAAGKGAPEGSLFTIGGRTQATQGLGRNDSLFTEGRDHAVFRAVEADAQGVISVTWAVNPRSNPPLNNNRFGPFNGLQIVGPISLAGDKPTGNAE